MKDVSAPCLTHALVGCTQQHAHCTTRLVLLQGCHYTLAPSMQPPTQLNPQHRLPVQRWMPVKYATGQVACKHF